MFLKGEFAKINALAVIGDITHLFILAVGFTQRLRLLYPTLTAFSWWLGTGSFLAA